MSINWIANFLKIECNTNQRQVGLDLFRSIALFAVLFAHSIDFFRETIPSSGHVFFLLKDAIEIFFTISGFLVGKQLVDSITKYGNWKRATREFYLKRWFKTLPAYYLVIGIHLVFGYLINDELLKDFSWRFLFFMQNIAAANFYFFPVSYSLAIEEWFYLLLPFGLSILSWIYYRHNQKNGIVVYLLFLIVIATCFRCYLYLFTDSHWDAVLRKSVISRLDAPVYGLAMAWLFYYQKDYFDRYRKNFFLTGLLLFAVMIFVKQYTQSSMLSSVFYFNLVPASLSLMIPYFYHFTIERCRLKHLLVYFSLTSYSFYLIHHTPIMFTMLYLSKPNTPIDSLMIWLFYLLVVFISTHVLYKYFEKPVMDLRKRFTN